MMQQINEFLSKKPDRRSITILVTVLVLLCLCCLCLFFLLLRPPTPPPPTTPTASQTLTPSLTLTPTPSASATETFTPTPSLTLTSSLTPSLTPTITPTRTKKPTLTPSMTLTPSITNTPNPLDFPQYLAVFRRTGNVWVTSRNNSSLVELDGRDLTVVSTMLVDSPNGIAIWQDRGLAYVTNEDYNTVTEIDLVARRITRRIQVEDRPFGVTVEQSTGDVFVANRGSNDVSCIPSNGAPVTSTGDKKVVLNRPTRLVGFLDNIMDYTAGAIVVDSVGRVAAVSIINECSIELITTINKDALADVDQSNPAETTSFYVSDIDGSSVAMVPRFVYPTPGVTPTYPTIDLPRSPYAVANFESCVGAVVPGQNRLYILDNDLTRILGQKKIGNQGNNGGWGLAYNPDGDTVYVANAAANSVTRIQKPCQ